MNWIARLVGEAAFPWVAAFAFGLAAGAWLDWASRRWDRVKDDDRAKSNKKDK